ncbi:MAG TPA: hypothetical protein VF789_26680 [Thermoanaerobaculia bacterium]
MIFRRTFIAMGMLVVWSVSAGVAHGQSEPAITIPKIKFLDAQYREFGLGDLFKVNLSPADLKNAGGAAALRLRIFRGGRSDLLGALGYPARDGCLIYRTGLFQAVEYNGGIRILAGDANVVFTDRWLSAGTEDSLADQHYVLVLERKEGEARPILKLRQQDAKAYFEKGFEFVVKSPRRPPQPSLIARLFQQEKTDREESKRVVQAVAGETPPQTRCRVFSPVTLAGDFTLIAENCATGTADRLR